MATIWKHLYIFKIFNHFVLEIKREEDGTGEGGAGEPGEADWEPSAKKRRPSDEQEAPKKQALRAHLALQLTHHTAKVFSFIHKTFHH